MRGYLAWDDGHLEDDLSVEFRYTQVYQEYAGSHPALRELKCLQVSLPAAVAEVREGDLLAGRRMFRPLGVAPSYWDDDTDGLDNVSFYADLGRLVEQLGFQIDVSGHAPDEETLKRCIRQLSPTATAAAPQSQPSAAVVDVLTRIETALNGLAERLGKIRLSSPEAQQFAPQSFVQPNLAAQSAVPQDPDRKSIENLSIRQLTTELFNEDQARELLLN